MIKNPPADSGNTGSIPDLGISPGEGNGTPLQYSCLGNPMDRGARWATVHSAAKSPTQLKWLSTKLCTYQSLNREIISCFDIYVKKIRRSQRKMREN